jgi:hypothetical protein
LVGWCCRHHVLLRAASPRPDRVLVRYAGSLETADLTVAQPFICLCRRRRGKIQVCRIVRTANAVR